MAWIRALWAFIVNLWTLYKQQKDEQKLQDQQAQLAQEKAATAASNKVQDAVNKVPRPDLDAGASAVDPMGIDEFNRRHSS